MEREREVRETEARRSRAQKTHQPALPIRNICNTHGSLLICIHTYMYIHMYLCIYTSKMKYIIQKSCEMTSKYMYIYLYIYIYKDRWIDG